MKKSIEAAHFQNHAILKTVAIASVIVIAAAGFSGFGRADVTRTVKTGGVEMTQDAPKSKTAAASVSSMVCWQNGTKIVDHQSPGRLLLGNEVAAQKLTVLGEKGERTIIVQLGESLCAISGTD